MQLPAAEARLVEVKQKALEAKALLDAKVAMEAKKKDLTAPFSDVFVVLLVEVTAEQPPLSPHIAARRWLRIHD